MAQKLPVGASFFLISLFSYTTFGFYCTLNPPRPQAKAAKFDIPSYATCVRATRHADYVTADVAIGTPFRQFSLLVKVGSVLNDTDDEPSMRLFSQQAVESSTVVCDANGLCNDVFITQNGTSGTREMAVAQFRYVNSASASTVAAALFLDGELSLRKGMHYWVTSTKFCFGMSRDTVPPSGTPAKVVEGHLYAEIEDLEQSKDLEHIPVLKSAYKTSKPNSITTVNLFPELSAIETAFISIRDASLYNREPRSIDIRRDIVELGVDWSNEIETLQKSLILYKLDCSVSCARESSVPFRRIATTSLSIRIDRDSNALFWTAHDPTLSHLPRLADSWEAFIASLIKLVAIVIAASVVYVRAKRSTASSSWLFKHCLGIVATEKHSEGGYEDRFIGAIALIIRGFMITFRANRLVVDDQSRIVIMESMAATLSLIHWLIRYDPAGQIKDGNAPLVRFGGSTALMDSSAAVMVAFSETPTLVVSIGRFDPTARLLTALLICLIVATRCAFSACCCGILWESEGNRNYRLLLIYSGLMWVFQSTALAALIADVFAAPCAYSVSRSLVGDSVYVRVMIFLAIFCAGLPRLTTTTRHILSNKEHVD